MQPSCKACPSCGAEGRCGFLCAYARCMITIEKGAAKVCPLTIARVICDSCGRTHALLADVLIPYGSYSLRFILHVLRAYLNRRCSVKALCQRYSIAVSTLYKWMRLFEECANLWLSVINRIAKVTIQSLDFFEGVDKLPSAFFKRYGFSFLQSRETTRCGSSP